MNNNCDGGSVAQASLTLWGCGYPCFLGVLLAPKECSTVLRFYSGYSFVSVQIRRLRIHFPKLVKKPGWDGWKMVRYVIVEMLYKCLYRIRKCKERKART